MLANPVRLVAVLMAPNTSCRITSCDSTLLSPSQLLSGQVAPRLLLRCRFRATRPRAPESHFNARSLSHPQKGTSLKGSHQAARAGGGKSVAVSQGLIGLMTKFEARERTPLATGCTTPGAAIATRPPMLEGRSSRPGPACRGKARQRRA